MSNLTQPLPDWVIRLPKGNKNKKTKLIGPSLCFTFNLAISLSSGPIADMLYLVSKIVLNLNVTVVVAETCFQQGRDVIDLPTPSQVFFFFGFDTIVSNSLSLLFVIHHMDLFRLRYLFCEPLYGLVYVCSLHKKQKQKHVFVSSSELHMLLLCI